jgi:hypothetical protein
MLDINEDLLYHAEFVLLPLTLDKLQETSALMSIQVGIPQSLTYKMKMLPVLPSYCFLFSLLCVMHKISFLISDSCEAYNWLDYTCEQKSKRKEKHKRTLHTGCLVPIRLFVW